MLAFSSVITLRESSGNSWINNSMNVLLSSNIIATILSTARIRTTLDVRSIEDAAWPSSQASAYSSQVLGFNWPVCSFLRIQNHRKVAKLPSYFVIEIIFALRVRSLSKYHQSCAPDVLADLLIKGWQANVWYCNCSTGSWYAEMWRS